MSFMVDGVNVVVKSVGLATAQGDSDTIINFLKKERTETWKWKSGSGQYAQEVYYACPDQKTIGSRRFTLLAQAAISDCVKNYSKKVPPVFTASCNGTVSLFEERQWQKSFDIDIENSLFENNPIVSGSCASGLQALYLAAMMVQSGHGDILVLAVDILSTSNLENFTSLRILSEEVLPPWHNNSSGFIPSEAAVAIIIGPPENQNSKSRHIYLNQLSLYSDVSLTRQYASALGLYKTLKPSLIMGQGTGPAQVDSKELGNIYSVFEKSAPITTSIYRFGHTTGASGILSMALAWLTLKEKEPPYSLLLPELLKNQKNLDSLKRLNEKNQLHFDSNNGSILILCRALSGACAIGTLSYLPVTPLLQNNTEWMEPGSPPLLYLNIMKKVFNEALHKRPLRPPKLLIVIMEHPILPEKRFVMNGKLLPGAILEITPSFVPQLISSAWGYVGPSMAILSTDGLHWKNNLFSKLNKSLSRDIVTVQIVTKNNRLEIQWENNG